MNRPHFRRHPRPTDPNPEYSRLDRLDGLHTRIDRLDRLDRLRTRYDVEWPSVLAAEAPGGDLAAMAAPADWPEFSGWGEGYEIEPWPRIGRHAWTPAEMRAMGDAIHDVVQAAHPPTPPVDEADVEALATDLFAARWPGVDWNLRADVQQQDYRTMARTLIADGWAKR